MPQWHTGRGIFSCIFGTGQENRKRLPHQKFLPDPECDLPEEPEKEPE